MKPPEVSTNGEQGLAPAAEAEGQRSGADGRWRALAGALSAAVVWTARPDGWVTGATGWEAATGLPEAGVLGRGWLDALHPEDRPRAETAWAAATAGGGAVPYDLELRFRAPDGTWRRRHVRGMPVRDPATGAVREWVGFAQDVEERRRAEAAAAEGEAAWRALVEATPGLVFVTDAEGRNTFTNRRYQDYAGLPAGALLGEGWLATLHPGDRARAAAIWAASVRTGEPYEAEYRFLRADGEARWHLVRGAPQRDPATGRIERWVGTCTDVDDSRRAEATNARLAAIVASTSDAVISFAAEDGRITTLNKGAEALFGYTAEEALGGPVGLLVPPELPEGDPTGVFARAMAGQPVHEHETVRLSKAGERIPVAVTAGRMTAADGRVLGVSGIFRDLRPRRAMEAALRDGEAFLRSVLDAFTDCVKVVDTEGRLEFMNAHGLCLMEIEDFGPLRGRDWAALWPEAGRAQVEAAVAAALAGRPARFEAFCPTAKGTPRWWDVAVAPARDAAGRVVRLVSASRDVTDRKQVEAALAASEAALRTALDAIPQMVWSTRPDGHHDFYNRRWYAFTGTTPEQAEGEGWSPQFHPDDRELAWARWRRSLATGDPYEIEYRLRAADGSYRWVLGRALPVRDPETGAILRWYGTCTEIEELVAARAALSEALEAKEALLNEVNHRVKNSLQLVSSLLSLQASRSADPELRAGLVEARGRIGVVAQVHRRLYQAGTHGRIEDLGGFLRDLCADLVAALDREGRIRLDAELPAAPIPAPIDRAVPLALVVSELATNAVKYAYPGGTGGTVRLLVSQDEEGGGLVVTIEDHGVGLPEGFDPAGGAAAGIGMRVVLTLVRQLRGRLEARRASPGGGAAFAVALPPPTGADGAAAPETT